MSLSGCDFERMTLTWTHLCCSSVWAITVLRTGNILSPCAVLTAPDESPPFILLMLQVCERQEFNMRPVGERNYGCWRGSIIERSQWSQCSEWLNCCVWAMTSSLFVCVCVCHKMHGTQCSYLLCLKTRLIWQALRYNNLKSN